MGTNYYLHEKPACESCGRGYEAKHIGKSSAGWCFSLHVIPEDGINDIDDWERLWSAPGAYIEDEYGARVSAEEIRIVIMARARKEDWDKAPFGYPSWEDFHRDNHSEPGPVGLLRHQLGRYCLKHGAGTWDCIPGEFS